MSYCPNCGSKNEDGAKFCGDCGTVIPTVKEIRPLKTSQETILSPFLNESPSKKMYCRNCGNNVLVDAFACTSCGLPPLKGKTHCQNCGADCHPDAVICIKCGVLLQNESVKPVSNSLKLPSIFQAAPVTQQQAVPQPRPHTAIQQNVVVMGGQKSVGVAFLLAFLFGPLGLLYASITGGVVLFLIGLVIGILTAGIGLIFTWVASIIWAVVAVNNHNERLSSHANSLINNKFNN